MFAWGRFEHGELGLGLGDDSVPFQKQRELEQELAAEKAAELGIDSKSELFSVDASQAFVNETDLLGDERAVRQEFGVAGKFVVSAYGKAVDSPIRLPVNAENITRIDCGHFHSAYLQGGGLITFGGDGSGQCGHGDVADQWLPRSVRSLKEKHVSDVSCSRSHTLVVVDGEVYAWGKARYGQLGFGGKNWDQMNPRQVASLQSIKIKQVAAGECHSMALSEAGEVYAWGRGKYGRLGVKTDQAQMYPKLITKLSGKKVARIRCGYYHSMAIARNGDLYVWGCNSYGQLGTGCLSEEYEPILRKMPRGKVIDVSGGAFHTLAVTDEGDVYSWGLNRYGQLGLGDQVDVVSPSPIEVFGMLRAPNTRVVVVRAGLFHSAALTHDGKLYTWGDGRYGQLGHGGFGMQLHPTIVRLKSGGRIAQIACGSWHTLALEGSTVEPVLQLQEDKESDLSSAKENQWGIFAMCVGGARGQKKSASSFPFPSTTPASASTSATTVPTNTPATSAAPAGSSSEAS